MDIQTREPSSGRYSQLPPELRHHILFFTDLAYIHTIGSGRFLGASHECGACYDLPSGCCCGLPSLAPSPGDETSMSNSSRPVKICYCRYGILPLLCVSRDFREDALHVLFSRSEFWFCGVLLENIRFLQRLERHVKLLKDIELDLDDPWPGGSNWNIERWVDLLDYMEERLSLSILAFDVAIVHEVDHEPLLEDNESMMHDCYSSLVPGLRRLIASGLKRVFIKFTYNWGEETDWQFRMGKGDILEWTTMTSWHG